MGLNTFEKVRDGVWENLTHDTITLVDPRKGFKLYARRDNGSRRPTWHKSLTEAKRHE
jgi:hypothetical protein